MSPVSELIHSLQYAFRHSAVYVGCSFGKDMCTVILMHRPFSFTCVPLVLLILFRNSLCLVLSINEESMVWKINKCKARVGYSFEKYFSCMLPVNYLQKNVFEKQTKLVVCILQNVTCIGSKMFQCSALYGWLSLPCQVAKQFIYSCSSLFLLR